MFSIRHCKFLKSIRVRPVGGAPSAPPAPMDGPRLVVPHPLQLFRGFGGIFPLPPPPATPLVYSVQCTMKLSNFLNFQSNANKYEIDLYRISTSGGGKIMRCFDIPWVKSSVHSCHSVCVRERMNEVRELGILI